MCLPAAHLPVLWPLVVSSLLHLLACFGSSCFVWAHFCFASLFLCSFGTSYLPDLGMSASLLLILIVLIHADVLPFITFRL